MELRRDEFEKQRKEEERERKKKKKEIKCTDMERDTYLILGKLKGANT